MKSINEIVSDLMAKNRKLSYKQARVSAVRQFKIERDKYIKEKQN